MIVLDSCSAVEMTRRSEVGLALKQAILVNEKVISCDLFQAEVASVFRKLTRIGGMSPVLAETFCAEAMSFVDEFYPLAELRAEALSESIRLDHSTYDMFYYVLARRMQAILFTTDHKLLKTCEQHGVSCASFIDF